MNPFKRPFEYYNDPEDFKMPYKLYGKTDYAVLEQKYYSLSNKSKWLEVRFRNGKNY